MRIGYHASHEQHSPRQLLEFIRLAYEAGFEHAMCSDHLMPFSEAQGHSAFAWSWLGAALESTSLSFGVVSSPGYRYHPAVLGQATATLADMYPGRFWVALGTGELLNEHVTGRHWPAKTRRKEDLAEHVGVIRELLAGKTVSRDGAASTEEARLYVLPEVPPPIIGAAITAETARWVGSWADGLITVAAPRPVMEQVISAFREGGGTGKPLFLQAQHSFAKTAEEAKSAALDQWRVSTLSSNVLADLRTPAQFDDATSTARVDDVLKNVRASADVFEHLRWLEEYREVGFDRVYVHNVQRDDRPFIEQFAERVLPEFANDCDGG